MQTAPGENSLLDPRSKVAAVPLRAPVHGVEGVHAGEAAILVGLVLLCGWATYPLLHIGWVPSDEGTLAESALRVYNGQLPHRDFAEIYTGGLGFVHALAFRLFGVSLFALRLSVFLVFLAWVPAVYLIARRMARPATATLLTLTVVSWTYPNYVAAMPSWYNLFLATFGALALLLYLEDLKATWLFAAGVCGGLSIDIKIIGLYFVAASLLFLLFQEQASAKAKQGPAQPNRLYQGLCALGLLLYLACVYSIVRPQLQDGGAYHFLLPSAACVALLLSRGRTRSACTSWERVLALGRLYGPFIFGVAAGIAPLLVPYLRAHALGALIQGVAGSTASRMTGLGDKLRIAGLASAPYGIVTLGLLGTALYAQWARRKSVILAATVMLGLVLGFSAYPRWPLQDTWLLGGMVIPSLVVFGAYLLAFQPALRTAVRVPSQLMLFLALAAVCSLVQYPVPWVTYFCYAATFPLFLVAAIVRAHPYRINQPLLSVILMFFLGFGVLGLIAKHVYNPGLRFGDLQTLTLPRAGGLRIDRTTPGYEQLIPFLQHHSDNGLLYAGNDCPELYFLSGLRNPTRDDTGAPVSAVMAALRTGQVHLVALNNRSFFSSSTVPQQLRSAVEQHLPHTVTIGQFSVYWR